MKSLLVLFLLCALIMPALAVDDSTEVDRVENSGHVLKEILNIPDNIPQDLLDKAECIIVLPSVKKAAFGVGGSYGRGVMICRGGISYTGPWGPPALVRPGRRQHRISARRPGYGLRPSGDEPSRSAIAAEK